MDNLRADVPTGSEIETLRLELESARREQAALAEVLRVVRLSGADASPAFDAILDACLRLFSPYGAAIYRVEGEMAVAVARRGFADGDWGPDATPLAGGFTGRALCERRPIHIADLADVPGLPERERAAARGCGGLTTLHVPMSFGERGLGSLALARRPKRPFSDAEIASLGAFADQAAIAVENARLFNEGQARARELEEALARQTATSDVLQVISRSPSDLKPVLDAIAETAARLCGSEMTMFFRFDGEAFRILASWNFPPDVQAILAADAPAPGHPSALGRAGASLKPVYIPDVLADPGYGLKTAQARAAYRATLAVPMLREGRLVGALSLNRSQAGSFTANHIALVSTFADQAAIAFENVRLFEEVRARTRDLEEALAQQTATANALKVISRSTLGLREVMQTLIDSAVRLCADDGVVYLRRGDVFLAEAAYDADEDKIRARNRTPRAPGRESMTGRVALSGEIEFIPDTLADSEFAVAPDLRLKGIRSLVGVPLLREGQVAGVFILGRREPGRFGARALELAKTFADQAVIVIENARLFEQVQTKTHDLEHALRQQTTMSEILRVISQSPTDARPVFESIVVAAARLLDCEMAFVMLVEGDRWRNVAVATPRGLGELVLTETFPIDGQANFPSRAIVAKETVYLPDWSQMELPPHQQRVQSLYGFQSSLHLPLLRNGECVCVLTLLSRRARAFGPGEIGVAESLRDQARIAIENTRLFTETQEALAQQTATAEVLKTISRSAFDLQSVLDTLIASAVALTGADSGLVYLQRDAAFYLHAHCDPGSEPEFIDLLKRRPQRPGRGSAGARVLLTGERQHLADISLDPEYDPGLRAATVSRALLGVPLKRDGAVIGAIVLARRRPGLFAPGQIELAETFADQAVIAVENSRLLAEVQARTRELERSLSDLRKAQDRLVQSEKLASLGQLTAGIAHEIKNPLNFVNNFASLSRDLIAEMRQALAQGESGEVEELAALIESNLEKVVRHGRRADSIVKNMLLHSRAGSGTRERVNVNAMVEEALNLAYHGARGETPGFDVAIEKALDPATGEADLYLQEITRVLLNLIANGFYATGRKRRTQGPDYAPKLTATTRPLGDRIEIRIRDNGEGVADEVKAKMFDPFFTTKPAGEGTGLGLSLSHDIVVKQHGGTLDVETEPGAFTEFVLTLPRDGACA